jgi:hypothetical protein
VAGSLLHAVQNDDIYCDIYCDSPIPTISKSSGQKRYWDQGHIVDSS